MLHSLTDPGKARGFSKSKPAVLTKDHDCLKIMSDQRSCLTKDHVGSKIMSDQRSCMTKYHVGLMIMSV